MPARQPDQLLLGGGGDGGAAPGEEGWHRQRGGLARALDAEGEDVVLGRRLQKAPAFPAQVDPVARGGADDQCLEVAARAQRLSPWVLGRPVPRTKRK